MSSVRSGQNHISESGKKLVSWKEIAEYFDRDERTAKRWERERGLPVHRAPGGKRSGVFAYPSELECWLQTRNQEQSRHPEAGLSEWQAKTARAPAAAVEHAAQRSSGRVFPSRHWKGWIGAGTVIFVVVAAARLIPSYERGVPRDASRQGAPWISLRHVPAPEAEELYLRGRYYWNLRAVDSLSKAIDAYTQALVRDPAYAEAYAGLAESYDLLPQFAHADPAESFVRAKSAANKAIELNPNVAAAHRAKGFALFFWDWDISGSDAEFQRALALDPNSAETHHWYASTLYNRLEGIECVRQIDEAHRLSPTSAAIATDTALFHAEFGPDFNASVRRLRELEQTQPTLLTPSSFLKQINFAKGDYPAYLAELRRIALITRNPDDLAIAKAAGRGWARAGKNGMLEAMLKVQKKAFEHGTEPGFWLGQTYLLLGRPGEALPYFKAALDKHFILMITMQDCDWAIKLASEPGYADLLAQIRERMHGHTGHATVLPVTFRLPQ